MDLFLIFNKNTWWNWMWFFICCWSREWSIDQPIARDFLVSLTNWCIILVFRAACFSHPAGPRNKLVLGYFTLVPTALSRLLAGEALARETETIFQSKILGIAVTVTN